jgi:hypothetical protein
MGHQQFVDWVCRGDCLVGTCHRVGPGDTTTEVTKRRPSHLIALSSGSQCSSPLPALTTLCDFPDASGLAMHTHTPPHTSPHLGTSAGHSGREARHPEAWTRVSREGQHRGGRSAGRVVRGVVVECRRGGRSRGCACVFVVGEVAGGWDERSGHECRALSRLTSSHPRCLDPLHPCPR